MGRPDQNLDRQTLLEKTLKRPENLCHRTMLSQGSCDCLPNMIKLFIRSRKSSIKASLDQGQNQNPSKRGIGSLSSGIGLLLYFAAYSSSSSTKRTKVDIFLVSEAIVSIYTCRKFHFPWWNIFLQVYVSFGYSTRGITASGENVLLERIFPQIVPSLFCLMKLIIFWKYFCGLLVCYWK